MPFGHEQSFDLMELEEMARIDGVAPKALPRCDDRDRRRVALHGADLHRRSVRPEQHRVGEPERVESFARRMIGGNVERVEVVIVRLGFGADDDRESVADEIRAALLDDAPDGVDRTGGLRDGREGDVDRVGKFAVEAARLEALRRGPQLELHRPDGVVDDHACVAPLLGCEFADAAPQRRDFAAASEVRHAHVFKRLPVVRGFDRIGKPPLQFPKLILQFRHHSRKWKTPGRSFSPGAPKNRLTFGAAYLAADDN